MLETEKIYEGHVLDILRTWPDKSIHMLATSPPYWNQRDYDTFELVWGGDPLCDHDWVEFIIPKGRGQVVGDEDAKGWVRASRLANPTKEERKSRLCSKCGAWLGSLGLEPSYKMYIANLGVVFQEVRRVLADYGTVFVNMGDTFYGSGSGHKIGKVGKHSHLSEIALRGISHRSRGTLNKELPMKCMVGIPERFMLMMIDELGFILRSKIIWWKRNAIPESHTDRFTLDFEPVYFFSKKSRYWHELQREASKEKSTQQKAWGAVGGKKYASLPKFSGKRAKKLRTRTMRSVWDIPTTKKKRKDSKHIAEWPTTLVARMIMSACPKEICTLCDKPRYPIYEAVEIEGIDEYYDIQIVDWTDCGCKASFVPGIAADIFTGSGTTQAVAKALHRRWVGIELKPDYVRDALERINDVDISQSSLESWIKGDDTEIAEISYVTLDDFQI